MLAAGASQGQEALQQGRGGAISWGAAWIAVAHGGHALLAEARPQPAPLTGAHTQQRRRRADIQRTGRHTRQNRGLALLFLVQGNRPHTFKYADIFPEQLTRTLSLSSNKSEIGS